MQEMKLKVMKHQCNECLFSKNKIVSNKRKEQILKDCEKKDRWFNCHKHQGDKVMCAGFFQEASRTNSSRIVYLAKMFGMLDFIEEKVGRKLLKAMRVIDEN